jgi:hypothetical protein
MNFFVLNVLFLDNLDHFAIFYQLSLIILMAYDDIYFDIILQSLCLCYYTHSV